MNSTVDLHSVSVDFSSHPRVEVQSIENPIRAQTTDFSEYLRKLAGINTPSVPCAVICIAFDLIFTLITLVIGGTNVSACPVEFRIPIYLVVSGTVNLVSVFFTIGASFLHIRGKDESMSGFFCVALSAVVIIILQLFNFIWLICGTVWVFTVFNQVQYDQMNQANYCQKNVFQYTVISIVFQYILPMIMCCCKNVSLKQCR